MIENMPPSHWYNLDYHSVVFDEASRNNYPLVFWFDSRQKLERSANTVAELIAGLEPLLADAETFLATAYPAVAEDER